MGDSGVALPNFRQTLPYGALGICIVMWMVVTLPTWIIGRSDFDQEAWPAYFWLMKGDFGAFLDRVPGYSSFTLIVGTPSALINDTLFDGSQQAMLILLALPGALVLGMLAGWLAASMKQMGRRSWWIVLVLCAGIEVGRNALRVGHPEDLLAAGAAVGGVLFAMYGRINAACALLIAGVLAKQWAVLAILPAALAAPRAGLRILVVAGAAAVVTVGLQLLLHPVARGSLTSTGEIFYQRNWWYPLGSEPAPGTVADRAGMLVAPSWLVPITHPLIVGIAAPLSAAWWWITRKRSRPVEDALGLLALLFLLRCTLDPWNAPYYHLPLVLSLAAWEVRGSRTFPWLALLTLLAVKWSFPVGWAGDQRGMDDWIRYTVWTGPLFLYLSVRVYGGPDWSVRRLLARLVSRGLRRRLQVGATSP